MVPRDSGVLSDDPSPVHADLVHVAGGGEGTGPCRPGTRTSVAGSDMAHGLGRESDV